MPTSCPRSRATSFAAARLTQGIRRLLLALLPVLMLTTAPTAHGQGMGPLPAPISSRELLRYAERLTLSPAQQQMFERAHDEYKAAYESLRERRIVPFQEEMGAMSGTMPSLDETKELVDEIEGITNAIGRVDAKFFQSLAPALSPAQAAHLPRLQLARTRARVQPMGQMAFMGRSVVNLGDIYDDLDVPPDARDVADSSVLAYERKFTDGMENVAREGGRMMLRIVEGLHAQGFGDLDNEEIMQNPEQMQKLMTAMQSIYAEATADLQEAAADLDSVNDRSVTAIAALLPEETGHQFRRAYAVKSVAQGQQLVTTSGAENLTKLSKDEKLPQSVRDEIAALEREFRPRVDRLLDEARTVMREQMATLSPFNAGAGRQGSQEQIKKLTEEATTIGSATSERLKTLLADQPPAVSHRAMLSPAERVELDGADAVPTAEAPAALAASHSHDASVASLSRHEMDSFAEFLELDEDARAIATVLYDEYDTSLESLSATQELEAARASMWAQDTDADQTVKRIAALQGQVDDARRGFQATFFDDLAISIPEAAAPRLDLLRREVSRGVSLAAPSSFGFGAGVAVVDLQTILRHEAADAFHDGAVCELFLEYDAKSRGAAEEYGRLNRARNAEFEEWNIKQQQRFREQRDGEDMTGQMAAESVRFQEIMGRHNDAISAASKTLASANETTLDAALALLPAEIQEPTRRAYWRAAQPEVYQDPIALHDVLDRALNLETLGAEQRSVIEDAASTYRREYDTLAQKLSDTVRQRGSFPMGGDTDEWKEFQRHEEVAQRLRFERNELTFRAMGRLRATLEESDLAAIGPLPDMDTVGTGPFGF